MLITLRTTAATAVAVIAGALTLAAQAGAAGCPNEQFRTGRAASLPDCRAYELVTPPEIARTGGVMLFEGGLDRALVSDDGEQPRLALDAKGVFIGPNPTVNGTHAVFSRGSSGWQIQSLALPAMANDTIVPELFSPDLSQVGLAFFNVLGGRGSVELSETLAIGKAGNPNATVASIPGSTGSSLVGANQGTPSAPAFSDVVFASEDHGLLPPGPEREAAEQTEPELNDLYLWAGGRLRLVNVNNQGGLLSPCGAVAGLGGGDGNALDAVSADGSKIFFTSPERECNGLQPQLYMRLDDSETVDVSEPQGVSVEPAARALVQYNGASADGSKVLFSTATALTPEAGPGFHLYEYDTEAPAGSRLKLVADEVAQANQELVNPNVVVSEDGSAVYYRGAGAVEANGHAISVSGIWRYDTATGERRFVAVPVEALNEAEPVYVTANGEFYLFPAGNGAQSPVEFLGPHGLEPELRGIGHDELYRYDATDGTVMCVSCGAGVAPTEGEMIEPFLNGFAAASVPREPRTISEDGRRVFFQTEARLVPQDTNQDIPGVQARTGVGTDVYEWEQSGTEEAPGVICRQQNGCTHLISTGEEVGPELLLGATADGKDVFFTSAAQLVPQATPEFTNIYDARIGGGFPSASPPAECTSCQGVGSPPPVFSSRATESFVGAGNPAGPAVSPSPSPKPKPKPRCRRGLRRNGHGRCVRVASRKRAVRR